MFLYLSRINNTGYLNQVIDSLHQKHEYDFNLIISFLEYYLKILEKKIEI